MEIDVLQKDACLDGTWEGSRGRRHRQFGLEIEELIKIGEKQVIFIEAGQAAPDLLKDPWAR